MKGNRGPYRRRPTWAPWIAKKLFWGTLFTLALGATVMLLWNAILPEVTGARPLSFLQGLGLLLLCRLLFYGGSARPPRNLSHPLKPRQNLPEEDRAAFLARIRQRLSECEKDEHPPFLR